MQKELISVIIPVYNVEAYLRECVDSVLKQTYSELEIILVDDGSKDSSGKICDDYARMDNRVTVYHKPNGGLSSARNYGIERANGTILSFVDSDDYIALNFIEVLYRDLKQYHADMSCCCHTIVFEDRSLREAAPKYKELTVLSGDGLLYGIYDDFSAWNKLYKARLFEDVRYPEGKLYEDARTTYRLAEKCGTVAYNPVCLYFYRQRSTSIMGTFNNDKFLDRINVWNELMDAMHDKVTADQRKAMKIRKNKLIADLLFTVLASGKIIENKNLLGELIKEIERSAIEEKSYSKKEKAALKLALLFAR